MSSGIENIFLIVAKGEFIAGMLGNGFIALVNCTDWVKSQKLSVDNGILTSLAISRITLLLIVLVDLLLTALWLHLYAIGERAKFISISWVLSNHLATWFAT